MRRKQHLRYVVTGPGLEEVSYADVGPALSRTITAASQSVEEVTYYARDSILGVIVGHSERDALGIVRTRRVA